jgi:hypothetical protein
MCKIFRQWASNYPGRCPLDCLASAPDGTLVTQKNGGCRLPNPRAEEYLGGSPVEGRKLAEALSTLGNAADWEALAKALISYCASTNYNGIMGARIIKECPGAGARLLPVMPNLGVPWR